MDDALRSTLTALLDPARVRWNHGRPAMGQEPAPDELFVAVGARDATLPPHPRMLSWKLPQWRAKQLRSSTEAVVESAEALDAMSLPLTLFLHDPTLDAVTAGILAVHRVLHHRWPLGVEPLVSYVSEWEQGRTDGAGTYERALASVYYASMQLFSAPGAPSRELLTLIVNALDRRCSLADLQALPVELVSRRVSRRLKADADLYRTELSRAHRVQLDLPVENQPSAYRRVDALFLSSPQDVTVLKLLARPDTEATTYGRGFELMAMHAPNEANVWARHTISIAPESPADLGDLALTLDTLEGDDAPDGSPRVKGQPRFSFQPPELQGLADPWYSDGYAWQRGRCTIVAPPFVGTKLTREQIWETVWRRFHVGRNVRVTGSRTVYARPFRRRDGLDANALRELGWSPSKLALGMGFLPSVTQSFGGGDVEHLEHHDSGLVTHVSLYPNGLALLWVEETSVTVRTLFEVTQEQSATLKDGRLDRTGALVALGSLIEPLERSKWNVFGAYRINRARSTMLDGSRAVQGLMHALASGEAPTLANLPSSAEVSARRAQLLTDVEHWFTPSGGARLELNLEDAHQAPPFDDDFALFLLTMGQRSTAFELTRRMGEVERASRTERWQRIKPTRELRADVMLFTNSLWYARISESPELNERYDNWRELHRVAETVSALREQTVELDEYRKERFENLVGTLLFIFLPITIVSGFFSGAQFNELELRVGWPWTTGGWILFLIYTAVFSVLVYGAVIGLRLFSRRKRS